MGGRCRSLVSFASLVGANDAVCTGVCLPSSLSGQAREERNDGANEKAAITLNAEMKHESAEHALMSWTCPDFSANVLEYTKRGNGGACRSSQASMDFLGD